MKRVVLPLLSLIFLASSSRGQAVNSSKGRFYFEEGDLRDFGSVATGQVINDTFWFENIGVEGIAMKFVSASNTCISADWSREIITAGQKGFVAYSFKPSTICGPFKSELFIQSNAAIPAGKSAYVLHVKGTVGKGSAKPGKKRKAKPKAAAK